MLDAYVHGAVERMSPEAPVPIVRQIETRESIGGAANVAANVASLGGASHLVACVGTDPEAQRLSALLGNAGISFDLVPVDSRPTTLKTRFSTGQHQLLRLDRENTQPIPAQCEAAVIAAIAARIDRCRLMILSDYGKGVLTERVLAEAIGLARARNVPVLVDPKRKDFSAYRGATIVTPNRGELEAATGSPARTDAEIERAAAVAMTITGASILVTRSEQGLSFVSPDSPPVHMPTQAREVFDVIGAGDTVIAAFAVAFALERSVEEAMRFANAAGGLAVSRQGTAVISAAELEEVAGEDEIVHLRQVWKAQGLSVGFTNGCFDLLHPGHMSLLRGAAQECDRLIVAINSDASVRRLKGPQRPVQTAEARAEILGAIEHVDLVLIFDEDTPRRLIERLLPDVLIKGADYAVESVVGADTVIAAGGRVVTIALVPGQSTTRLIDRGRRGR